jgi:hypothetical protein
MYMVTYCRFVSAVLMRIMATVQKKQGGDRTAKLCSWACQSIYVEIALPVCCTLPT